MFASSRLALALAINTAIVISTVIVMLRFFRTEDGRHTWKQGADRLKFFTTQSNIFVAITALVISVPEIVVLIKSTSCDSSIAVELPIIPLVVKYVGTAAIALTMFTVLFFLGPTQGYKEMFSGKSFFTHLANPLLAIISFCFFENVTELSLLWAILALVPGIIYGALYYNKVMNLGPLNGGWEDFYGFNVRDRWKISLTVALIGSIIINVALLIIHNK